MALPCPYKGEEVSVSFWARTLKFETGLLARFSFFILNCSSFVQMNGIT